MTLSTERRLCPKCLTDRTPSPRAYAIIILIIFCSMTFLWQTVADLMQIRLFRCYNQGESAIKIETTSVIFSMQVGNILTPLDEAKVPIGQSFFFHETSCALNDIVKDIHLNARQACAVESTALHHPNNSVYLLIVAPVFTKLDATQNPAVLGLLRYPNVYIRHINLFEYLKKTPMINVLSSLRRSRYPVSHTSDVLRYTTLSKFRGTYMDLDVIVLKPLLNTTNFVGAESVHSIGAGIINFGPDDKVGKAMADECAAELTKTFDGEDWGTNGPGVITRVLARKCKAKTIAEMFNNDCQGFHVYRVPTFYAFPYWEASMFFKPGKLSHAQKIINSSQVIHYWNKVSASLEIPKNGTNVPFLHYARINCPQVYETVKGIF